MSDKRENKKLKFTVTWIEKQKPGKKTIEYFETARTDKGSFGLRISPGGTKVFFLMVYQSGKVNRYPLGKYAKKTNEEKKEITLKAARDKATQIVAMTNQGIDLHYLNKKKKNSETVDDLWKLYTTGTRFTHLAANTKKEYLRLYKTSLLEPLGEMHVVDIEFRDLARIINAMAQKAPVQANRLYSLLSVLFNHAKAEGLISLSPMIGTTKPTKKEKPKQTVLDCKGIISFFEMIQTIPQQPADIMRLILFTCQRPGEVRQMEYSEVDLKKRLWVIPAEKTKTNVKNKIPLSSASLHILEPYIKKRSESGFVFESKRKDAVYPNPTLDSARVLMLDRHPEVKRFTCHDLRRTGRTILAQVAAYHIGELILNHSLGKIHEAYNKYDYEAEKLTALQDLVTYIELCYFCND